MCVSSFGCVGGEEPYQRRSAAASTYFSQRRVSSISSVTCGRSSRASQRLSGAANPSLVLRRRTTKLGFAAPDRRWLARELRPQVTELIRSEEHTSELQSRSDLVCR